MADAKAIYRAHPTREEIDDVLAQRLSAANDAWLPDD